MGSLDHGLLNLPLNKRGAGSIDRQIDKAVATVAAEREAARQQSIAAYRESNKPIPFTTEELKAARAIRTSTGWHRVIRVNAKSVTVGTCYSWNDRHAIEKILEVRS